MNSQTKTSPISQIMENQIKDGNQVQETNVIKHGIETVKRGLRFVWKDFKSCHLIWVKVAFFLQSASLVTLYPYLVSISSALFDLKMF